MQTILLFGSTGFIGSHLKKHLEDLGFKIYHPRIEIRNLETVKKTIEEVNPDIIINATGITGKPNVDWCEDQPGETFSVNVGGSLNIAQSAHEKGIYMVQVGSGCIYDGRPEAGYTETDEPNYFGSLYSRSRAYSEKLLSEFPNILQLRIRIPILGRPHRKNLIDKLIKYPQMINIANSCTVIEDFLPATTTLIQNRETGIFNMTNIGSMDHKSIMTLYKEIVDPNFEINLMSQKDQEELCKKRSNCILNSEKRESVGAHMPPLEESLKRVLLEYKKNKKESGIRNKDSENQKGLSSNIKLTLRSNPTMKNPSRFIA